MGSIGYCRPEVAPFCILFKGRERGRASNKNVFTIVATFVLSSPTSPLRVLSYWVISLPSPPSLRRYKDLRWIHLLSSRKRVQAHVELDWEEDIRSLNGSKLRISVEVNDDLIKAIIDSDRHSTTREIAEKLHVSHTCIENHLTTWLCSKTRYMGSSGTERKAFNATH